MTNNEIRIKKITTIIARKKKRQGQNEITKQYRVNM
jgi:hypothetical protein